MNKATPEMRGLAQRLVAYETRGKTSVGKKTLAALLVCEKLRPLLATLMGNGGFRGLMARALALATVEAPWLQSAQVKADGSLDGLDAVVTQVDPKKLEEGSVALISQLLRLLYSFIGEDLTVRFVREAWPKLSFNDSNFGPEGRK